MSTETRGHDADVDPGTDLGELAEVPPDQRLDHDPPDDNGLGDTGLEDVSDVPVGDVLWRDEEEP